MEGYIPIFEIIIDEESEDSGFIRNSFVKNPAVEVERFAFNKQERMVFASDEVEQVFTSVSILADTPIYREGPNGEPFYVVFSKDVIRKIRNKLVKDGKTNEVSLYHDDNKVQDGIYMVEQFIINKGRIESPLFKDVPDGSLVTSYWVEDRSKYEELLADENFRGFSIEINAHISQLFSKSFDAMYSEDKIVQEIKAITFREDITDLQKEHLIKKVLNK